VTCVSGGGRDDGQTPFTLSAALGGIVRLAEAVEITKASGPRRRNSRRFVEG
jgi:hypothetical protein